MCGFAGVIGWDEKYRIDRATLQRMSARIAHRGPDGEGIYLDDQHEITPERPLVGLAFRRLAIIDLDERSNQPFTSSDGRYVMVFNGEIYNYRELRTAISKHLPDYQWRTSGDTETLLMSYAVWKEKCVEQLNGMFAFAVWDNQEKSLYLARDRMGQKPLYVATPACGCNGKIPAIAVASELSALRAVPWFCENLNHLALVDYLRWGYSLSQRGPFEMSLPFSPAGWWRFQHADFSEGGKYFDPSEASSGIRDTPSCRTLIQVAVQRQLVADVPLGCFLSGGIDSSIIAATMRQASNDVHTFSIGFDDPRYDESEYAALVAGHLGTTHHEFHVRPDAAQDLPKLAKAFGEPFGDSSALPTHYLARETRKHVKVALSGDGGDELFGGYDRYEAMAIAKQHAWLRAISPLRYLFPAGHSKSRSARIRRFLSSLHSPEAQRYAGYMRFFQEAEIDALCGPEIRKSRNRHDRFMEELNTNQGIQWNDNSVDTIFNRFLASRDVTASALATDRITYLPNDLLTKVDRCSMLHGLEVRSPFMDHELVQFAAGLTTDQLLKGGKKRMLREAFAKDLPDFVFKRKKMGFAVPIGEWFRGELRAMLRDHLFASDGFCRQHFNMRVVERLVDEHEQQRVDHSQRLYALLMLEMWWKHVVNGN